MSTSLALRINEKLFYGWLVLGVGGLGIFASGPAQSFIFSVYLTPVLDRLPTHWMFAWALMSMNK